MTHQQRFDNQVTSNRVFAPLSHGCPSMTMATDYSVFKKTPDERGKLATYKSKLPKTRGYKFETVMHEQF